MRKHHRALIPSLLLLAWACAKPTPQAVTESFWTAIRENAVEKAKALSTEGSKDMVGRSDAEPEIAGVEVGEAVVTGATARVPTRLVTDDGRARLEFEFETILRQRDGAWLVDAEESSDAMSRAAIAAAMEDAAKELGRGLREAMQEGVKAFRDAVADGEKE